MKLYIWKHKNTANNMLNFYPLSKARATEPNGIYPIACHAFFKKKEAKKYLNEIGWDKDVQKYYELITLIVS